MSKPMLVTWPFVMLLLDYWPLKTDCGLRNAELRTCNRACLVREKIPFFVLAAAASVVTFVVQKHGGAVVTVANLPAGRALRKRADFVLPLSGEVVLANGSGRFLSAPRVLAAGEGAAGGWVDPGHFGACVWCSGGESVFAGGLAVVCRDAGAGDRIGADWASQAMADRYTYIPSLGVLILAVWGVYELTRRWRYQ